MTKDEIDEMLTPLPHDRICSFVREYFAKSHDKKRIVDVYGFAINEAPGQQAGRYLTPELAFVGSYDMSSAAEELVVKLAELSITHEIVAATYGENEHLVVMVRESIDHQTNIDAELIDVIIGQLKEIA